MLNQLPKALQRVMLGTLATSMAVSAGTALAAPNPGGHRQRDVIGGYTSTQIVVKLQPKAMATAAAQRHFQTAMHDEDPRAALSNEVRTETDHWRTKRMRPAYSEPFADPALAAKHGLDRTFIIEVPEGTDTEAMAAAFVALGGDIEAATVDTIGGVADSIPNDTYFNLQYALHNTGQTGGVAGADIDAPAAWGLHTGNFGTVTIAIIDSGVNSHVDYGNNVGPYPNGRIVEGHNTANPLTPTRTIDECPHGTHVAGIAAATGNNGMGVAGVTWGANIMPVRVLLDAPNGCSGYVSALAAGIRWAADHGADVGNMSLQYYNITQTEYNLLSDAVNYAHDLGMILIGAAGNNNGNGQVLPGVVAYPAKLLNCMGVSGTTDDDLFADLAGTGNLWFSNYGNEVDVCAPGDRIRSTWTSNGYADLSGTSMATPHVSGLAALVKSYVPALTNVDLELLLEFSADDKGPAGWDNHYGFGRINAYNALLTADIWFGIIASLPSDGAIDARKPTDRDGSNAYGWQSIELTYGRIASTPASTDFVITQQGGVSGAPVIGNMVQINSRVLTMNLDRIIETRARTTISHLASGTSVRLGYLPGDVNANGTSNAQDVAALIDALNGVGGSRPVWSLDIDRSGALTGADLLEVVDLLNGAGAFEPYLDATLP